MRSRHPGILGRNMGNEHRSPPGGGPGPRRFRIVAALLVALPFPLLLAWILSLAVDLPFYDQWDFLPLLDHFFHGTWSLAEVHHQHNEHRLLFPQLLMLGLATLTRWDTRWECAASFGFAIAIGLGLVELLRRAWGGSLGGTARWVAVLGALFVCSLHQWENWLWGWQLQIFMSVAAFVWTLALLGRAGPPPGRVLAAAAGLAVLSSFSFGSGMLVWPLGLLVLATRQGGSRGRRRSVAAWVLAALAASAGYLAGFDPTGPFTAAGRTGQFGHVLPGLGVFLGVPLVGTAAGRHPWVGLAGLAAFAALGLAAWRRRREEPCAMPLVALGLHSVGAGLMIGYGRFRFDPGAAVAPRYATFSDLLWVAGLALAGLAARRGGRRWTGAWACAAAGVAGLLLATQPASWRAGLDHRAFLVAARRGMVTGQGITHELAKRLHAGLVGFGIGREKLLELRLSLFRDPAVAARARQATDPKMVLSYERAAADTSMTLEVAHGKAGHFVALYAILAPTLVFPVFIGSFGENGRLRVPIPLPAGPAGRTVRFVAVTLNDHGAALLSEPLDVML